MGAVRRKGRHDTTIFCNKIKRFDIQVSFVIVRTKQVHGIILKV